MISQLPVCGAVDHWDI